jgi:hypothetical protein
MSLLAFSYNPLAFAKLRLGSEKVAFAPFWNQKSNKMNPKLSGYARLKSK